MIIRFRSLEALMMPHLLLLSLFPDSHRLPYELFHIISHFILVNMPVRYGSLKIADKLSHSLQPDISSRLLAFTPLSNCMIPLHTAWVPVLLFRFPAGHFPH